MKKQEIEIVEEVPMAKKPKEINRTALTWIILMFPSLVIAMENDLIIKTLVLAFQGIIIGNMLKDYERRMQ